MAGVATTHPSYDLYEDQWLRCRDCVAGTDAVKGRGVKYLPPLDSHTKEGGGAKYDAYKLRALFYNAAGRTVAGLAGGIFQKAPAVSEVDGVVTEHCKDITLTGTPIDMFALDVTKEFLTTGRFGILIDVSAELVGTPRPFWIGYKAEDIVNWRYEVQNGDQILVLVVLREQVNDIDPKDEFCPDQKTQYRVLRLSNGIYTQQIYHKVEKSSVVVHTQGAANVIPANDETFEPGAITTPIRRGKPLDFIPFSLPWTIGAPPLIDLVDVNLSHYRGYADLKHGLHFTALPTPWVSGKSDGSEVLSIGSGTAWQLDPNGSAGMVEFTGKGLGSIRTDLQDMQRMMATLGARLLEEAPHYAETALSVSLRHSSDYATLRTIAQIVEQQISWALKVHSWWLTTGDKKITDLKANVELNKIFFDAQLSADELRALLLALQSKSISYKTFYARLSATGWTRESVSFDEELKDIDDQPDDIGMPPAKPGDGGPQDPNKPVGPDNPPRDKKLPVQKASGTKESVN
jgi:hypothetical protein